MNARWETPYAAPDRGIRLPSEPVIRNPRDQRPGRLACRFTACYSIQRPSWVAASFWSSCGIARPIHDRLRKESTETSDRPVSHRSVDGVTEFGGVKDGSREAAASGCGFERMAHD